MFVYRSPTSQQVRDLENRKSGFDQSLVRSRLMQVGAEWITVNNEEFKSYDGNHLDKENAEKLSLLLGKEIVGSLDI